MKIGILAFGYQGFRQFGEQVAERGFFSSNLGDNIQSIAVRRALARLGVAADEMVAIDRDAARHYDGPPIALVMNGVFPERCLPLPPQVIPLFIGFSAVPTAVAAHSGYLKHHEPIGCRDPATAEACLSQGIAAFTTGCLTLTLPCRTEAAAASADRVLAIYGSGAGAFPSALLKWVPAEWLDRMEFVSQRLVHSVYPLDEHCRSSADLYAASLMERYEQTARLVITPLHHAAAPCIAMGIPVVLAREQLDWRFGFLSQLIPVHTPESFSQIDWSPAPVRIEEVRQALLQQLANSIARVRAL